MKDGTNKRLAVVFDAECLVSNTRSGVGHYTRGLVENLAKAYPNVDFVGHYFSFLGQTKPANLPSAPNLRYVITTSMPVKVPNMLRRLGLPLPFELFTHKKADFHLFPAFTDWPSIYGTKSAVMVHDTTFLDHPELVDTVARFDLQKLVPKAVRRAAFILTNSDFSAGRLREQLPVGDKPIVVGHIPPVNTVVVEPARADKLVAGLNIIGNYILFVGNLEPRKNLPRLIAAYKNLPEAQRRKYSLVLTGGKGWLDDPIAEAIEDAKGQGLQVITTGYVTDEQRGALFQKATVFAFVSTYEGFGMQLLEAMQYRTAILASDIPPFREAAADTAAYCDPNSVDDISKQLSTLLNDAILRADLIKKGQERLKLFSWADVAKRVIEQIRLAIGS